MERNELECLRAKHRANVGGTCTLDAIRDRAMDAASLDGAPGADAAVEELGAATRDWYNAGCRGYVQDSRDIVTLCDEVEDLRAQVAAAPEALREWPTAEKDAPGEWAHFTTDEGIRVGRFLNLPHMGGYVVAFERSGNRTIRLPDAFLPGEFFVRVP